MMQNDRLYKGLAAFNERVQGLLSDGYHILIEHKDDTICLTKLRHHNGNRIILKLDYKSGILSQHTNNIQCYHHKVC